MAGGTVSITETCARVLVVALAAAAGVLAASPQNTVPSARSRYATLDGMRIHDRVFQGVSHFLMMEQPESINRAIGEFLAKNRLPGGSR
jgi:pimeloyl-ACP methyl ester carboxylesterase